MVDEKKEKQSAEDTGEGDKPEEPAIITRTNEVAERLEKANEKREELLRREEELLARRELHGRSEAGAKEVKEEMTPQEYANSLVEKGVNLLK